MSKNQQNIAIREDSKLLRQARTVFGDLVKKAWVTAYHYDHVPKSDTEERLKMSSDKLNERNKAGTLRYDTEDIILEFSNGKTVMFTSSEWNAMILVNIEDYKVM